MDDATKEAKAKEKAMLAAQAAEQKCSLALDGLHEPPVYVREKGGPLNC